MVCGNIFTAPSPPIWLEMGLSVYDYDFESRRASKLHYWFKSYGDFAEWVDFAYWWSFSGGGSAINGATPSSLFTCIRVKSTIKAVLKNNFYFIFGTKWLQIGPKTTVRRRAPVRLTV